MIIVYGDDQLKLRGKALSEAPEASPSVTDEKKLCARRLARDFRNTFADGLCALPRE